MKMKILRIALVFTLISMTGNMAWAQCKEYKWPEDKVKAEESVAIYGDAMKQGNYRGATAAIQWMLTNAPNWNTKLYIDGAEIYDKLAEKETDPAKKQVLIDSLMWMYDTRIKICGEEATVLNRKANALFKHSIKNKDKSAELLALYDKVFELNGNNVTDPSLTNYMNVVKANSLYLKNLTDEQILQRYDKISLAIDAKTKIALEKGKPTDADKLKSYKDNIDAILVSMVKVDCAFVKKNLEPKFRQNPNDIALAKKIFGFMLNDKCTDDPLWLEVAEAIHKVEKDYGLAKNIGVRYLSLDNNQKAEVYLKEALSLAKDASSKGEVLIYLGGIEAKKGNKSGARDLYRQSLAADPSNKEGFEKIGDLYQNSVSECSKKVSMAEDRLVYIAAYEMYQRAGDNQKMANARSQFPSVTEIFELSWKEGESKKIECWIGESVVLKTRGKD
ncbi:MAG: tetratricopeptide repeat protein [Bacteroidota bacterium]